MVEGGRDLIIGIGNPLRGDDRVGWWLAQRAESFQRGLQRPVDQVGQPAPGLPQGSEVIAVQQLTPELAQELSTARRVLFLDAWWPPANGLAGDQSQALDGTFQQVLSSPDTQLSEPIEGSEGMHEATFPGWPAVQTLVSHPLPDRPWLGRLAADAGRLDASGFSHQLDPGQLLAITALLYGRVPEGWILLVPASAVPHGEGFSAQLEPLLPQAELLLWRWCAGGFSDA